MWRDNSNFDIKLHGISGWRMAMTSGRCLWLEAGVDVFVSSDAANRLSVGAVLFVINAAGRGAYIRLGEYRSRGQGDQCDGKFDVFIMGLC